MTTSKEKEIKSRRFAIRFTPSEYTNVKKYADEYGLPVGEYIRLVAQHKKIRHKKIKQIDINAVNELKRQGANFKHCYSEIAKKIDNLNETLKENKSSQQFAIKDLINVSELFATKEKIDKLIDMIIDDYKEKEIDW